MFVNNFELVLTHPWVKYYTIYVILKKKNDLLPLKQPFTFVMQLHLQKGQVVKKYVYSELLHINYAIEIIA